MAASRLTMNSKPSAETRVTVLEGPSSDDEDEAISEPRDSRRVENEVWSMVGYTARINVCTRIKIG